MEDHQRKDPPSNFDGLRRCLWRQERASSGLSTGVRESFGAASEADFLRPYFQLRRGSYRQSTNTNHHPESCPDTPAEIVLHYTVMTYIVPFGRWSDFAIQNQSALLPRR